MPAVSAKRIIQACCPTALKPALVKIEGSEISYRIAKGMFWTVAGATVSRGSVLVAFIFIARMLGKTGYGELGIVQSTAGMFGVFAGFGLGLTATKHVAEFRRADPVRAGRILSLSAAFATITGGLMAIVLAGMAPWLAEHTINAPHLAGALRIGALLLFISVLNGAQTGALSGFEAFRTIAHVNVVVGLLSFPILIAGVYLADLSGVVWALVINLAVNWALNHLALRREARRYHVPLTLKGCWSEISVLWRFSLPAGLSSALVGPVNWACSAMLVNRTDGYAEMGVFNAANQWYVILLFLPGLLGQVVLPVLSERLGLNQIEQTKWALVFAIKMNMLLILPPIVVVTIASPYVMSLYGESFRPGWPTLVTVLWTAGLIAAQTPLGHVIAASGRMWMGFIMNTGWALVFTVATVLLVHFGAQGLAAARAAGYLVHSLWVFGFAYCLIRRDAITT